MNWRTSSPALLISLLASQAGSSPPSSINREYISWWGDLNWCWTLDPGNPTTAPAWVAGYAVAPSLQSETEEDVCDECLGDVDANADDGDLVLQASISATTAADGCLPVDELQNSTGGQVDGSITLSTGEFEVSAKSSIEEKTIFDSECTEVGRCQTLVPSTAAGGAHLEYNFSTGTSSVIVLSVDLSVDVGILWWDNNPTPSCAPGRSLTGLPGGALASVRVTALDSNGSTLASWIDSGSITTADAQSLSQSGLLADEDFSAYEDGDAFGIAGDTTLTYNVPIGTKTLLLTFSGHASSEAQGDFDHDGRVCWTARDAMGDAWHTYAGQPDYDSSVDFDFDGYVDATDLDALNDIECSGDFNCDGVVNFSDYSGFSNAFSAQNVSADMNYDASWDFFDVQMFLGAYAVGCP